jgi:hypothetical protein
VLGSALVLYALGPALLDGGPIANAILLGPCSVVVLAVAVVVMAWSDWLSMVEITGPTLDLSRAR